MTGYLDELSDLDHDLMSLFLESELNTEEITQLVDKRERLLLSLKEERQKTPEFERSPEWLAAVARTQQLVEQMQAKTGQIGEELKKYRHGNKSVQRYKQFL
ncbi:flagellar protein FliT [Vibrio sp. HA2012]|uniref:flagellar protein FliT n=1 Tax=Vibrio sp. HA2012 TaxID=1971595 RepID=UPI000C2B6723|nr:flagellar protein FliT [Vibrio sp. HA2012]PJC88274.1 flagellar protein FliT [Vibrio sp. HA2012]